jgi:uncharacterized membrane protein
MYFPFLHQTLVSVVFALPVVLFIPGYCFIAVLFPKNDDISLSERIALSIGLSVAIVPLIGFWLNFTPWGIRLEPVLVSLTVFTLVMVLIAHYLRALLPQEKRFDVHFSGIPGTFWNTLTLKESSKVGRLLTVILTLILLASILVAVYVIGVPKEGERFTEFFILGENRTAADYPTMILSTKNYPMYIGVASHENRNITYTIETWGMFIEFDNVTNTSRIVSMDPLLRRSLTLANNETTNIPYNLSVEKTGYNRVEFLLFNETVPGLEVTGSDRINASYRDLYLRINVTDMAAQEPSL